MNFAEKLHAALLDSTIHNVAVQEVTMVDEISPEQDENGNHPSTIPVSARLERIDQYLANAPK